MKTPLRAFVLDEGEFSFDAQIGAVGFVTRLKPNSAEAAYAIHPSSRALATAA